MYMRVVTHTKNNFIGKKYTLRMKSISYKFIWANLNKNSFKPSSMLHPFKRCVTNNRRYPNYRVALPQMIL